MQSECVTRRVAKDPRGAGDDWQAYAYVTPVQVSGGATGWEVRLVDGLARCSLATVYLDNDPAPDVLAALWTCYESGRDAR